MFWHYFDIFSDFFMVLGCVWLAWDAVKNRGMKNGRN